MDQTNLEDLRNWRERTSHRTEVQIVFETFLFVLLEIVAIGGNVMVLAAVWRSKSLRSITHQYITVLSTADLCVALLDFSLCVASSTTGDWPYGQVACHIQGTSILLWSTFSMFIVSMTAINRYFCVVKPNLYKTIFTRKSTIIVISTTLVISMAIIIGIPTGLEVKYQFGPHLFCIPVFPTKKLQMAVLLPAHFAFISIPMLTIFVCYFKVFRHVRQHVNKVAPSLSRAKTQNLKSRVEEVKITKVVFAVMIVFFLLWTPVCVIGTLFLIGVFIPRWAHLTYDYLVITSAATNPILYGFLNQTFRSEYAKILGCKSLQRRRRNDLTEIEFSASHTQRENRIRIK
ncbi:melatonin receptor type 1A-like [Actinia tenebrosa]|uniref:Melatonin receptor type 1A-like n=1 Tax=Actinia tenebrosa TaxID=6105 RepID=A0A6P8HKW0_ACTTE|nr:melatonin receptor type 1A-like [Actinia tenebrosa]